MIISIVAHPNDRNCLLFSNPASKKRERMTVRLSRDEGKTWPHAKALDAGPAAYSCLAVLRDGNIGCLYERGDKSLYETITFARISLDWLTETEQSARKRRILYNLDGDSCMFLKKGSAEYIGTTEDATFSIIPAQECPSAAFSC